MMVLCMWINEYHYRLEDCYKLENSLCISNKADQPDNQLVSGISPKSVTQHEFTRTDDMAAEVLPYYAYKSMVHSTAKHTVS